MNRRIGLAVLLIGIIAFGGCSNKKDGDAPVNQGQIGSEDNNSGSQDGNEEKEENQEKGEENNTGDEGNNEQGGEDNGQEDGNTDMNETEYIFEATIENPEELFQDIERTIAYKAVGYNNPLMTQRFGADPFAMVYKDRVYVYMTNDSQQLSFNSEGKALDNTYGKINTLNCISSEDLVNWTDHGTIQVGRPLGAATWANNSWAPAAAYKNIDGKDQFFLYFANSAGGIGVLQSDSPVGPFRDPIGRPLISKSTPNCSDVIWMFDPAVFVDDDGRAYIYFGGGVPEDNPESPGTARMVELGADMISLAGIPEVIDAPFIFEDSGINKIGDTYYYSYCSNWSTRDNAVGPHVPGTAEIIYMTSKNPLGPWEYQGSFFKNPGRFFGTWGNNHHSMVEFKGKWYLFYHTQLLQDNMGITGGYRSTHVDEVTVTQDGKLMPVQGTRMGVKQIVNLDPYQVIEAETIAWMGGVLTRKIVKPEGSFGEINNAVSDIQTGDWMGVAGVDFGDQSPKKFTAKVSSEFAGNVIRITADQPDGQCLGYLEVPNTGSESEFVQVSIDVENIEGVHNLFFTFHGEGFLFDSWSFQR